MLQKTPQELDRREAGGLASVSIVSVTIGKVDITILQRQQSVVRDRDAMRVASQIVQQLPGTSERSFRIHHPAVAIELSYPVTPGGRVGQP